MRNDLLLSSAEYAADYTKIATLSEDEDETWRDKSIFTYRINLLITDAFASF